MSRSAGIRDGLEGTPSPRAGRGAAPRLDGGAGS